MNKFVEFYGTGLDHLPLADRATIANMAPEYGATCGFFPIDDETLRYLRVSGRDEERIALVEAYAKANGMWRGADYDPVYTDTLALDMAQRRAVARRAEAAAGPGAAERRGAATSAEVVRRHRDNVGYKSEVRWDNEGGAPEPADVPGHHEGQNGKDRWVKVEGEDYRIHDGSGGDRGDHLLHQHLEPLRDDRRRPGRAQGARAGADPQALGEDLAGAGQPGGQRLPGGRRAAGGSRRDRLQPGRLRLHHLHRQLRAAAGGDLQGDRPTATSSPARCCRATATSRAG